MDYRRLLEKYMGMVNAEEGTTFVSDARLKDFTREEMDVLKEIEAAIYQVAADDPIDDTKLPELP